MTEEIVSRYTLVVEDDPDTSVGSAPALPCQNPGCLNLIVDHGEEQCRHCGHWIQTELIK